MAAFLLSLRRLRIWAGNPSLGVLRTRTGIARTTIHDALREGRSTLPSLELVRLLTVACGSGPDEVRRWEDSWRRLTSGGRGSAGCTEGLAAVPLPRQLPARPRTFVGRAAELAALSGALLPDDTGAAPVGVAVISGQGGVGKSWLAVRWATDHGDAFVDGQLFIDLHGYDPVNDPTSAHAALHALLIALGVEPTSVPREHAARVGLYRSLSAARRLLVVLDNARDARQVMPLLPGSRTCSVLVTSRNRLTGLTSACDALPVPLDVLDGSSARQLLARHLGQPRLDAEPDTVLDLLDWCAGLPLALSVLGARLAAQPSFPLGAIADELRDASSRLDGLHTGDLINEVRTVFSCSRRALSAAAAEMFTLIGLTVGADISLPAAASLSGQPVVRTRATLRELVTANLLQEQVPGRYRAHDLVRLYAGECARALPPEAVDLPLRRLVDFYLHTAYAGDRLFDPQRPPIEVTPPQDGTVPLPLNDQPAAVAWFTAEHEAILAAQRLAASRGWFAAWQLAWALSNYHRRQGHRHARVDAWELALASAHRLDRPAEAAVAHRHLGHAYAGIGRHELAAEHLRRALEFFTEARDELGLAHTHHAFGWVYGQRADHQQALHHASRALDLFQALGHPSWTADALNAAGWYLAQLDRLDQARTYCLRALDLCRDSAQPEDEAYTLDSLGYIAARLGQGDEAVARYEQALARFRQLGNTVMEADVLTALGPLYQAATRLTDALHAWQRAERLFAVQGLDEERDRAAERIACLRELLRR